MPAVSGAAKALPYHKTFSYTGQRQTFTVPAGVKSLTVVALGARGAGTDGANGGRIYALIPVTPAEKLTVFVGGRGSGTSGGFNGGGNAGGSAYGCYCPAYGGGGASDIRQGGHKLRDRVLVAGGGGGEGGKGDDYAMQGGAGGKGGGASGGAGSQGQGGAGGGAGGTQHRGGHGGRGAPAGSLSCGGSSGDAGSRGQGGDGGAGCSASGYNYGGGGGGAGGGYYGGGGGGGGSGCFYCGTPGGGGGGGSSYIEPSAKRFQSWQGWKSKTGNGLVVFSWK